MGHYAKVKDGVVTQVIVAEADFFDTFVDNEPGEWIQTSYNTRGGQHYDPETGEVDDGTPLRKNYAGVGFTYDRDRDAFIPPQPYASWTLDEDTCLWNPPYSMPELTEQEVSDGKYYIWDEATHQADNTQGWVLVG